MLKLLMVSAEVAPFAKRGGLGDVAGSLPKALRAQGHDVRIIMPAYGNIERGMDGVRPKPLQLTVPTGAGPVQAGLFESTLPSSDVPVYFIAEWHLFNREEVYGYSDDSYRFSFFSRAVFELLAALNWRPDVLHAHDWHTAPAVTWLATAGQADNRFRGLRSLYTIHNLAHQGLTPWSIMDYLGIVTHGLLEESYGAVNWMARGIYHAAKVNTVSPTYAYEITTPSGGANVDGLLRHRGSDVSGILNGIDADRWNPETDNRLPHHFGRTDFLRRVFNKRELQAQAQLPQRDDVPLLSMISRLDGQKGLDIMGAALYQLLATEDVQVVILGSGAAQYEAMLASLAGLFPHKMHAFLEYNAGLAPLIYGGSDMFLMPSLFEPCGLSQMLSMRYGTVPIVRATGGLVDTVWDNVTGFVFDEYTSEAFYHALERAIGNYRYNKAGWRSMQQAGMRQDFSWDRSARQYEALYRSII